MTKRFMVICTLLMVLAAALAVAEEGSSSAANTNAKTATASETGAVVNTSVSTPTAVVADPLLRILVNKGILTPGEAANLRGNPAANQQLLQILMSKGILSDSDISALRAAAPPAGESSSNTPNPIEVSAVSASPVQGTTTPPPPAFIPAVAPVRVMPIDTPKRDGLIPAIKLGPVKATLYGFLKMSTVYDTSQPRGDDFPLPGWAVFTDTGPNTAPEFHVKARNSRFGTNLEWLDKSEKLAITGRLEFDFEGNMTAVDNRNVSAARSNQPSLRLAYGRLDYYTTPQTDLYLVAGQDWTPFGSSTLPNTLEGTGVGISFGSLYERAPMVKGGFVHTIGGSRNVKWLTEFAAVQPFFGNVPGASQFQIPGTLPGAGSNSNVFTVTGCTPLAPATTCTVTVPQIANTGLGLQNQLAFGERQGSDSGRPEVEARVALQFQLDKAPGVAPAQIILSGVQGERVAVVPVGNIPNAPTALGTGFYRAAFPTGLRVSSDRYGVNPQIQLPTRWFTLLASFYHGADLRWFFAGELFSTYNQTAGLGNTVTAASADGSSGVVLGTLNGAATVAPQRPVRTNGGFFELGLPLSRWAHAEPTGRNAGWTMNLHYGLDDALADDVHHVSPTASTRDKSDWAFANLQWKMNNWVAFGFEESLYRTRALSTPAGAFTAATSVSGVPSREWKDVRSEFTTTFTF